MLARQNFLTFDHIACHLWCCWRERKNSIALHALAHWDGETVEDITSHLGQARTILHRLRAQPAPWAFDSAGRSHTLCEAQIITISKVPSGTSPFVPGEIIWCIDTFVEALHNHYCNA